jgi:hypothetical protein
MPFLRKGETSEPREYQPLPREMIVSQIVADAFRLSLRDQDIDTETPAIANLQRRLMEKVRRDVQED